MLEAGRSGSEGGWPSRAFVQTAFFCTFLGVSVGLVLFAVLPRRFTSNSAVVSAPESRTAPSGTLATLGAAFGVSVQEGIANPLLIQDLIRSRGVLDAVLERSFSVGDTAPPATLRSILTREAEHTPKSEAKARGKLTSAIFTSVDTRTGIVRLGVRLPDPWLARAVNTALIEEADVTYREMRRTHAGSRRRFVEGRVDVARKDLADAEEALRSFHQQNYVRESPSLQLEDRRLQREVDARHEAYTALSRDLEVALQEEARDVPSLGIFTHPDLPWQKSFPSGTRLVGGGFGAGLIIALLLTSIALKAQSRVPPRELRTASDVARAITGRLRTRRPAA